MSDKLYQTLVRGVNCKYNSPSAQYDRETRERGSKSPTRRGFRKRGNLSKIQRYCNRNSKEKETPGFCNAHTTLSVVSLQMRHCAFAFLGSNLIIWFVDMNYYQNIYIMGIIFLTSSVTINFRRDVDSI